METVARSLYYYRLMEFVVLYCHLMEIVSVARTSSMP